MALAVCAAGNVAVTIRYHVHHLYIFSMALFGGQASKSIEPRVLTSKHEGEGYVDWEKSVSPGRFLTSKYADAGMHTHAHKQWLSYIY